MLDKITTLPNIILSLAVWAVLVTVRKIHPGSSSHHGYQRTLPMLPLVLGVAGSLLGLGSGSTLPEKIAIGLIFGAAAGQGFKIGKTSILGLGLPAKAARPAPKVSPPTPPKG